MDLIVSKGRITELIGIMARANLPNAKIGDLCLILNRGNPSLPAEIVGFRNDDVLLMPYGSLSGIANDSEIVSTGKPLSVKCSNSLRGRILNGLGHPMDGKGEIVGRDAIDQIVEADSPPPLTRKRITRPLTLGFRAIDGLLTCGEGQRLGIFAAAGTGKSTLLGSIAKTAQVDVNVVALIGERGREVMDFIEESLGEEGLARSVLVVAASDQPSLVRLKAAFVSMAIAEYFRNQGLKVLFMMDSVTRFARAQREIGLAVGEPPTRGGYTPSVFSTLPRLLERAGNSSMGGITALFTVLVAGDDITEPVADEVMSILDGHILLSRSLASRNHYPAIDILNSKSRIMSQIADEEHLRLAAKFINSYSVYETNRDAISYGFYKTGSDKGIDEAISLFPKMEKFLIQKDSNFEGLKKTVSTLNAVFETLK